MELGALDDDQVVFKVVDEVLMPTVFSAPDDHQRAVVRSLSPGLRGLWGIWIVDGEVNNGGFQRFFWMTRATMWRRPARGTR